MLQAMIRIDDHLEIDPGELQFQAARSSGPGGQHVNKVSTKMVMRWDVQQSPSLPEAVRRRFLAAFGHRVRKDGVLVMSSDRHRSQTRNQAACVDRLVEMLRSVAHPPKPRRPTRPSRSAKAKRLEKKRQRSVTKRGRKSPSADD